jgi:opacity protein-like surface antigen
MPANGSARAVVFPTLHLDFVENGSPWKEIMRTYSTAKIAGAVLTAMLFASCAFAADHSALNGTWTLMPAKSDFAGQPVVQTGTVTIADREGIIIVSRSFVYAGAAETFFYSDLTDSEHNATIRTGKNLKSKTRWDHGVLKVTTTDSGAITLESYALAADGTMTVNVVRPARKPITLFFQHQ